MSSTTAEPARFAGQSVIEELFRLLASREPRGRMARFFGVRPLTQEANPWYIGARGEIAVGRLLEQLPADWTVLHSLPVGTKDSDLDHLVIGPGGVFVINTKHHAGKKIWIAGSSTRVDGRPQPYIRNAEHEAKAVEKLLAKVGLSAPVVPVIAFVDPAEITVKEKPARVQVLDAQKLVKSLTRQPNAVDPEQVVQVAAVLADPGLWRPVPAARSGLLEDFMALQRDVRAATAVRMTWVGATFAAGMSAAITLGPQLMTAALASILR